MKARTPDIRKTGALGALIGVAGMLAAAVEGAARRRAEGERAAKAAFLEWLNLGFAYPAFANPDVAISVHGKAIPDDPALFEQYEWFVAIFLNTAEEIFRLAHGRRGWTAWDSVLSDQISFHAAYLKGPWKDDGYDRHYSRSFRAFIDNVLETAPADQWLGRPDPASAALPV